MTLQGHGNRVSAVALTQDGKHAVSGSDDCTLKVWNRARHEVIATYSCDQPVHAIALSHHGIIVAGDAAGRIHAFKLEGA